MAVPSGADFSYRVDDGKFVGYRKLGQSRQLPIKIALLFRARNARLQSNAASTNHRRMDDHRPGGELFGGGG